MVEVESQESPLFFPFELGSVLGLPDPHVRYVHMHSCRQEAAPELTHTHSSADFWIDHCCPVIRFFHIVRLWAVNFSRICWTAIVTLRFLTSPALSRWPPLSQLSCSVVKLFTIDKWPCEGMRAACVSHLSPSSYHLHELMKRCTDRCPLWERGGAAAQQRRRKKGLVIWFGILVASFLLTTGERRRFHWD